MMQIINDLTPLNRVFCSSDYDKSIDYLCNILPFKIHSYTPDQEHNGWVIPPKWDVEEAKIMMDGKVIYDATEHPLRLISLSLPFEGRVSSEELKKHLHYDVRYEDAVPYHFRHLYRSWERDWGFCVPKTFYDSLKPGEYEIVIKTKESEGELKVLEYNKRGKLDETILFASHLDHPGMSNDDLAGCAVGVELFRELSKMETKFSYKLLLHQEIIGAEYYLAFLEPKFRDKLIEGMFLEMLGSNTQLGIQSAVQGMTDIEYYLKDVVVKHNIPHRKKQYGEIVVNGEYIFAGYGIPISSFSRYPYPEYHTDKDNPNIIYSASLIESLNLLLEAIKLMEKSPIVKKKFKGTICTSNPKYGLYVDPGQASFGWKDDEQEKKIRKLMELLPSINSPVNVERLSSSYSLDKNMVLDYLKKWELKALIDII